MHRLLVAFGFTHLNRSFLLKSRLLLAPSPPVSSSLCTSICGIPILGPASMTVPRLAYLTGFVLSAIYKRVYQYNSQDHESFRLIVASMSLTKDEAAAKKDDPLYAEITALSKGGLIYPKPCAVAYLVWLDCAITAVLDADGKDKLHERSMWANRRVMDLLASVRHRQAWQAFVLQAQGRHGMAVYSSSVWDRFAKLFRSPFFTLRVGERALRQTQSEVKTNSDRTNLRQALKPRDSAGDK
ncbi:hypothetical protein BCR44DRAFT_223954 [Catenaria anguillulae PL171]|uniref:Uncharacterized protein n=1 Tax=Catenaria anguillulae PL171 TaxID=765915 RepID=A0A1Y2HDF4_9FUNG|nr:hypothetical protein BCR44DRAFT_223954 [Catenaria anguillulae PL171]